MCIAGSHSLERYLDHLSHFAFALGVSYGTVLAESISKGSTMRKLPVFKALGHAFRSTTDNIGFAFHISWPWVLILLPFNVASNLYMVLNGLETGGEPNPEMLGKFFAVTIPLALASAVAYSSIAVNWHRYVLLDEIAEGWQRLRIDSLTWRYIGNFILIFLILMVCAIPVAAVLGLVSYLLISLLGGGESLPVLLIPAAVALYALAFIVAYRLLVKLPAVALGRRDFSMGDAWRATKGNSLRLLGLLILFVLSLLLFAAGMFAITYLFGLLGTVGLSLAVAIQVMVNWVATILGVTLLTSLYGFFVEGREF